MNLTQINRKLNDLKGQQTYLTRLLEENEEKLDYERAEVLAAEEAQTIIQQVAARVQESAHKQIAAVVTRCLASVFPEPYEFKIEFEQKRGKTEARLVFVRDGQEVDPMSSAGGGVIDVAAFALRLACLVLARPRRRRLLVMDEPFRFVSASYVPAVKCMVETIAAEMGVQIVMVTHQHGLQAGTVLELE